MYAARHDCDHLIRTVSCLSNEHRPVLATEYYHCVGRLALSLLHKECCVHKLWTLLYSGFSRHGLCMQGNLSSRMTQKLACSSVSRKWSAAIGGQLVQSLWNNSNCGCTLLETNPARCWPCLGVLVCYLIGLLTTATSQV